MRLILVVVLLAAASLVAADQKVGFHNLTRKTSKLQTLVIEFEQPLDEKNVTELFYKTLHETIANDSSIKVYVKRVECIVDELKKANARDKISDEHFKVMQDQNGTLKVGVFASDKIMKELELVIYKENINCIIPGAIALVFIVIMLTIIMSCIVCLSRGDHPIKVY